MTQHDDLLRASARDRRRARTWAICAVVVFAIPLSIGWAASWSGREAWRDQAHRWQQEYLDLYGEYTSATGEEPAAPTPKKVAEKGPEPAKGEQGIPGPVGPAGKDGVGATGAPGKAGADGKDGKDGKDGVGFPGAPGKDGVDGLSGADAPPVTDEQILAMVQACFSAGACVAPAGPAGPAGSAGSDGAPGRGIESIACSADAIWVVTYTDGTSQATNGAC